MRDSSHNVSRPLFDVGNREPQYADAFLIEQPSSTALVVLRPLMVDGAINLYA